MDAVKVMTKDAYQARRRLRYEELFFLELELIEQEQKRIEGAVPFEHVVQGPNQDALRALLPFVLTKDQEEAIAAISTNMAKAYPMNHLLLGDVGTGKTMVAAFAIAACADTGTQALMMGPTEVLVQQYGASLGETVPDSGDSVMVCESCGGSGMCDACGGDGWADNIYYGEHNDFECTVCDQTGVCPVCDGEGVWIFD